jgi:biopolymer transport protein ExbB/TolQ
MTAYASVMVFLQLTFIDQMIWILMGLMTLIAIFLFLFLILHRRNNLRRFAELEEKILFFHPSINAEKHAHPDLRQLIAELNALKEKVAQLQKLSSGDPTNNITSEKIELFKKGIHQHLNDLHERIKLNEINTNRMLNYLEDLREALSQTED